MGKRLKIKYVIKNGRMNIIGQLIFRFLFIETSSEKRPAAGKCMAAGLFAISDSRDLMKSDPLPPYSQVPPQFQNPETGRKMTCCYKT